MKHNRSTGRATAWTFASIALGATLLLPACASDSGEEATEARFPELVDVPPRPQASTTPEERAALKTRLERRRDEINRAAASLLRGGTEPVPVSLEHEVPSAPSDAGVPPPPLPKGLPPSPERPAADADEGAAGQAPKPAKPEPRKEEVIEAPEEEDMPPPRAAGEKDEGEDQDEEGAEGDEGA